MNLRESHVDMSGAPDRRIAVRTGQVSPSQRVVTWRNALARTVGWHDDVRQRLVEEDGIEFESFDGKFAGDIDTVTLPNFRVSRVSVSSHRVTLAPNPGSNSSTQVLFALQTKGTSTFEHDGDSIELEPGQIASIAFRRPLKITNERLSEYYIVWSPQVSQLDSARLAHARGRHLVGNSAMQRLLRVVVERVISEPTFSEPSAEQFLSETLLRLLDLAFRECDDVPVDTAGRLSHKSIVWYIEQNLHDCSLSPDTIAQHFGCSKRTVYRGFGGGPDGESLNRYLWRRRIERSAEEMRGNLASGRQVTVTEVAFSFGFSSCAHFSRLFRQHMGISPLRFKQQA